jgi:hypothetical protein
VNCCLNAHPGTVEFLDAGPLGGTVAEYDPYLFRYATERGVRADGSGKPVRVSRPARTIRSVLYEYRAPSVIDYWSLDTEGAELTLLQSFPFDAYTVRVLTVEHNWLPARERIRAFLESRGYTRARELGCDDGYVRTNVAQNSWRSAALRPRRR